MSPTALSILRIARALISTPAQWCQHEGALNAEGSSSSPRSPEATSFCSWGAVRKAGLLLKAGPSACNEALRQLSEAAGGNIVEFNDTPGRTWEQVSQVFAEAQRTLEAERVFEAEALALFLAAH